MSTHGSSIPRRLLVLSLIAAFAAAPAAALLSVVETLRDVPIRSPADLVVSGDDRFVYMLGNSSLAVFERDAATGLLTFVEAYLDGYGGVEGIFAAGSMVLSPDGRFLYAASPVYPGAGVGTRWAIAVFKRDAADGTLRLASVVSRRYPSARRGGVDLAMTSDGAYLYAAAATEAAVVVFRRRPADGSLSLAGGTSDHVDPRSATLHPVLDGDDRFLYLAQLKLTLTEYDQGSLTVYARDAASGALTFVEEHVNRVDGVEDLDRPNGAAVSPDGAHVYVMNSVLFPYDGDGGAVVAFGRDSATGRLAYIGTQDYPPSPYDPTWNDDGTLLYAAGLAGGESEPVSELLTYERDPLSGTLTEIARLAEDPELAGEPSPLRVMALTSDRRHLYAGSFNRRLLGVWEVADDGSLTALDDPDDPTGGRGALRGAARAAVSPGGRHVYVSSPDSYGLAVYERDRFTGRLALVDFVTDPYADDERVAVSADGRWVYALSSVFARSAATGLLDRVPQPGNDVRLFGGDFVPSPDGRHLYVLGGRPIDGYAQAPRGRLQPVEIAIPPVPRRGPLAGADAAAVSADGAFLFAAGIFAGASGRGDELAAVWVFARDAASGSLKLEAFADLGPPDLSVERLALAPNGRHLYAVRPDELLVFRYEPAARRLRLIERHAGGGDDGLADPRDVAVSPSGRLVYVAGRAGDAVAVFRRDPRSGRLTFQEAVRGDGLVQPQGLAVAPSDRHLYVTSARLAAVTVLALE